MCVEYETILLQFFTQAHVFELCKSNHSFNLSTIFENIWHKRINYTTTFLETEGIFQPDTTGGGMKRDFEPHGY